MSDNKTPASLSTSTQDLEWIQLDEELSEIEERGAIMNKLKRVAITNPLIPFGIFATCGSLIYGLRSMIEGNRQRSQIAMRYRVFFQAVTIVAITLSSVSMMKIRRKSPETTEQNST